MSKTVLSMLMAGNVLKAFTSSLRPFSPVSFQDVVNDTDDSCVRNCAIPTCIHDSLDELDFLYNNR